MSDMMPPTLDPRPLPLPVNQLEAKLSSTDATYEKVTFMDYLFEQNWFVVTIISIFAVVLFVIAKVAGF